MPPPVLTKADFVIRYKAGEFGNSSPTWNNPDEYQADTSRPAGLVHIRNRIAGGETWYNVDPKYLQQNWTKAALLYSSSNLYLSSMAPHEQNLLQGEVSRSPSYLYLHCSNAIGLPMRDALQQNPQDLSGILAICRLKSALCPNSYEWLWYLLDEYPDHVVEFSAFSVNWGSIPGFNTVFWEVRKY